MRIVALETSTSGGSVAALEGQNCLAQQQLPAGQRSAQSLAPAIQALVSQVGWQVSSIEAVAVTVGPGSFTGLRIGLSTAKALAYGVGAAIVGVDTLEVIARRAAAALSGSENQTIHAALDAQRGEVFAATFMCGAAGEISVQRPTSLLDGRAWLDTLQPGQVVTGPVLERLAAQLPAGVVALDAALWMPTAAVVGQLGHNLLAAARADDVFQLVPHYHRRTAAEEQWERLGR